jgi:hypothetical protein
VPVPNACGCGNSAMSNALPGPMTIGEFPAREEQQELRYESDGLQPAAVAGGTVRHARIQCNLLSALSVRLRTGPCQPFGSGLKIEVAGHIRYPDAFVICKPVADDAIVITDPTTVFEVLSSGTAGTCWVVKNEEYRNTRRFSDMSCWNSYGRRRPYLPGRGTTGRDTCCRARPSWRCRKSAYPFR